ncbi:MAG: DUF1134 domain-containing protein [Aquisalinus sp.]|nr:DUF1134 domain-containing protein [Aquisalinus sp.]
MKKPTALLTSSLIAFALAGCVTPSQSQNASRNQGYEQSRTTEGYRTYDQGTVADEAEKFFGGASAGLADVLNRVFTDKGRPQGYIAGEEVAAAAGVGLRYGNGYLYRPGQSPVRVFWTGPSFGLDAGGNASKVFTLVYDLGDTDRLFQRFPGVDGSAYYVGGVGVNYQRDGQTVLAPIRTGVGLRGGVNIGYLNYTRKYTVVPF